MAKVKRQCLGCGLTADVVSSVEDAKKEVVTCPSCDGAFVDVWRIGKYKETVYAQKVYLDCEQCGYVVDVIARGNTLDEIERYSEPCKDCSGPMFTRSYIEKKKKEVRESKSDEIKNIVDEINSIGKPKEKYLTIEIENENDVPIIFHNGKRIEKLQELILHWSTATADTPSGTTVEVQHIDIDREHLRSVRVEERYGYHID